MARGRERGLGEAHEGRYTQRFRDGELIASDTPADDPLASDDAGKGTALRVCGSAAAESSASKLRAFMARKGTPYVPRFPALGEKPAAASEKGAFGRLILTP